MKRAPSKDQIRSEIEQQVSDFLGEGGEIRQVEPGASGLHDGDLPSGGFSFDGPRQTRTPVPEVVAAIEARRRPKLHSVRKAIEPRAPKKKIIYDDFGEPLRWVWIND